MSQKTSLPSPNALRVVHAERDGLNSEIDGLTARRHKLAAQIEAIVLAPQLGEQAVTQAARLKSEVEILDRRIALLQERVDSLGGKVESLFNDTEVGLFRVLDSAIAAERERISDFLLPVFADKAQRDAVAEDADSVVRLKQCNPSAIRPGLRNDPWRAFDQLCDRVEAARKLLS